MLFLLLMGVGVFYILQQILYEKYWNRGLGIAVRFESHAVYEGDTAFLREEITNDKLLPLPALEVNLAVDRALKFSGEAKENANVTDQSYRRDIFSLFARQRVIRKLSFACGKRGYYELGKADVIGYDFFFRKSFHDDRILKTSMFVYPKPVDSRRIALLCRAVSGMTVTEQRIFPDPFCFSGIRDYRPSDPMHQINWKASAKGQGLLVNQFDATTDIRMKLILDTEDTGMIRQDKLNEEGIRIASSLASKLVKGRMEVTVTGNGMNQIHMKEGAGQIHELYEELARIDIYRKTERICKELEREKRELSPNVIYVIISMNQDKETAGTIASLAEKGNSVLWVIPTASAQLADTGLQGGVRELESLRGITIFQWEMEG